MQKMHSACVPLGACLVAAHASLCVASCAAWFVVACLPCQRVAVVEICARMDFLLSANDELSGVQVYGSGSIQFSVRARNSQTLADMRTRITPCILKAELEKGGLRAATILIPPSSSASGPSSSAIEWSCSSNTTSNYTSTAANYTWNYTSTAAYYTWNYTSSAANYTHTPGINYTTTPSPFQPTTTPSPFQPPGGIRCFAGYQQEVVCGKDVTACVTYVGMGVADSDGAGSGSGSSWTSGTDLVQLMAQVGRCADAALAEDLGIACGGRSGLQVTSTGSYAYECCSGTLCNRGGLNQSSFAQLMSVLPTKQYCSDEGLTCHKDIAKAYQCMLTSLPGISMEDPCFGAFLPTIGCLEAYCRATTEPDDGSCCAHYYGNDGASCAGCPSQDTTPDAASGFLCRPSIQADGVASDKRDCVTFEMDSAQCSAAGLHWMPSNCPRSPVDSANPDYASAGCPADKVGDRMCDPLCMSAASAMDGGDCLMVSMMMLNKFTAIDANGDGAVDVEEFKTKYGNVVGDDFELDYGSGRMMLDVVHVAGTPRMLDRYEFNLFLLRHDAVVQDQLFRDQLFQAEMTLPGVSVSLGAATFVVLTGDANMDGMLSLDEAEQAFGISDQDFALMLRLAGRDASGTMLEVRDVARVLHGLIAAHAGDKWADREGQKGFSVEEAVRIGIKFVDYNRDGLMSRAESSLLLMPPGLFRAMLPPGASDENLEVEDILDALDDIISCDEMLIVDRPGDLSLKTLWMPRGKCSVLVLPGWNLPGSYSVDHAPKCNVSSSTGAGTATYDGGDDHGVSRRLLSLLAKNHQRDVVSTALSSKTKTSKTHGRHRHKSPKGDSQALRRSKVLAELKELRKARPASQTRKLLLSRRADVSTALAQTVEKSAVRLVEKGMRSRLDKHAMRAYRRAVRRGSALRAHDQESTGHNSQSSNVSSDDDRVANVSKDFSFVTRVLNGCECFLCLYRQRECGMVYGHVRGCRAVHGVCRRGTDAGVCGCGVCAALILSFRACRHIAWACVQLLSWSRVIQFFGGRHHSWSRVIQFFGRRHHSILRAPLDGGPARHPERGYRWCAVWLLPVHCVCDVHDGDVGEHSRAWTRR